MYLRSKSPVIGSRNIVINFGFIRNNSTCRVVRLKKIFSLHFLTENFRIQIFCSLPSRFEVTTRSETPTTRKFSFKIPISPSHFHMHLFLLPFSLVFTLSYSIIKPIHLRNKIPIDHIFVLTPTIHLVVLIRFTLLTFSFPCI